ncbi:MAG: hypothetical protein OCD01_00625 [Fibrobacterales bacterium]
MSKIKSKSISLAQQFLIIVTILFICVFNGCSNGSTSTSGDSGDELGVQFNYTLEGVYSQTVAPHSTLAKIGVAENSASTENLVGIMSIYSHETGDTVLIDWYVTLDEDTKTLTSNMTIVLPLGFYDFSLELQNGGRQYLGSVHNLDLTPETTVALAVTPVIGDVTLIYTVNELPKLTFSYPVHELAAITDPKIGYSIDGATEIIIDLSNSSGQSALYLNVTEGAHIIELTLYDGAQLIATSRPEQENVTVVKAQDNTLDLIPLVAEVIFTTTMDGGEATFVLKIPTEVVDEVGSLQNLKALFKLVSPRNTLIEDSLTLTLNADSSGYTTTLVVSNYFYDTVSVDLEFWDIATNEVIAQSIESGIQLGSSTQSIAFSIDLIRRAVISGNLLSFVGINVFDSTHTPVAGATVTLNDTIIGITGSGIFGTPGYVGFFSIAGTYNLSAFNNSDSTGVAITLDVLGASNHILILEPVIAPEADQTNLANGDGFSLFLKDDGALWATGNNTHGQLGDGTTIDKTFPVQIMSNVHAVAADDSHSLILKNDQTLWTTGYNMYGQLGDGTTTSKSTPVQIMSDVRFIAAGSHHSLIVKTDNTLWATGWNNYGQLGDGTTINKSTPVQIMSDVQSVSAGTYHSLIVKTDNTLWATGRNESGQFGDGTTTNSSIPIQIGGNSGAGVSTNALKVAALSIGPIRSVSAGEHHSLILKSDNTLWSTGQNTFGQLGDGTTTDRVAPVYIMSDVASASAGSFNTLIAKNDNTLWATGQNDNGQLGDGSTTNRMTPVQTKSNVQSVSAGTFHSLMVTTDSTLMATGLNTFGQFGNGTTVSSSNFLLAALPSDTKVRSLSSGNGHSLFLQGNGILWGAGNNSFGQLGNGTVINTTNRIQIMSGVRSISTGGYHSLILKTDNTLWATGYNNRGQLGDGTFVDKLMPIQIMSDVESISAGYYHSLVLKTDSTLWAAGYNFFGQLGDGDTSNKSNFVQIMSNVQNMSAGAFHSLIVKTDNTLWATGYNNHGQLGNGTTQNKSTPIQVMSAVQSVAAGPEHSLILKLDSSAWATGDNNYGQLGNSTWVDQLTPVHVLSDVQSIYTGGDHSLFIKSDNALWASGLNYFGQFGDGTKQDRNTPVHVLNGVQFADGGHYYTLIVKQDETIAASGRNFYGQFGTGSTGEVAAFINITP